MAGRIEGAASEPPETAGSDLICMLSEGREEPKRMGASSSDSLPVSDSAPCDFPPLLPVCEHLKFMSDRPEQPQMDEILGSPAGFLDARDRKDPYRAVVE